MESLTKNRQSAATLRAMIARAYGDDRVPEGDDFATELSDGWFNVLYRIRLRDGATVVLKIAPPKGVDVLTRERGMMANEIVAMELVRERSSAPVPRVHFSDATGEIIEADYFFMDHVDAACFGAAAEDGRLTPAEVAAGFEHLGEVNRELCSIVGPHFGDLAGPGYATWREAATALFEDVLADAARASVDMGWTADALREAWADHADALDEVTEPRFVEVDLWDKNAMIRDGRIVAVIDHERALWGDPIMEAGFTGLDLSTFPDPEPFMRGFGVTELSAGERTRRHLYTLMLAVTMVVECTYRGLTPEHRAWTDEQLTIVMGLLGRTR